MKSVRTKSNSAAVRAAKRLEKRLPVKPTSDGETTYSDKEIRGIIKSLRG